MKTFWIPPAAWVLLLALPLGAAAQQSPARPGAPDPTLTDKEREVVDILAGFYKRVEAAVPDDTEKMADRLNNWSREVRTVAFLGEVMVGLKVGDYGNNVRDVYIYEDRRYTRLYFQPFTAKKDLGTNAEYDSATGLLAINTDVVKQDQLKPDSWISEKYPNGERAVPHLTQRISIAQTVYHEMIHTKQFLPGWYGNEARAYRGALQTTLVWLERFEKDYAAARTKENARYVWAAANAWLGYQHFIATEIIPEKKATSDALPPPDELRDQIARVTAIRDIMKQQHQAIEILEQMAGPSVIPGAARTLNEMLVGLTAHDSKELEERVRKAARDAVEKGAGVSLGREVPATQDQNADLLARGALPFFRDEWGRRMQDVAKAVRDLEAFQPVLRLPQEGVLDPEKGTAKLTVEVENDAVFAQLVDALGKSLQVATGDPAKLAVVESWSATDFPTDSRVWHSGAAKTFEFSKAQDYEIKLQRIVRTRVKVVSPRVPPKITLESDGFFVVEAAKFPTVEELEGIWKGTLAITEIPMLTGAAEGTAPPGSECQEQGIDPGQLRELKQKAASLRVEFQTNPDSETEGVIILTVQPPEGIKAVPPEPARLPYKYEEGALTIEFEPPGKAKLLMNAQFVTTAEGWRFSGGWSLIDNTENRNVTAIVGVWAGEKKK